MDRSHQLMPHIEVQFEYEINKEEKKCIMHQADLAVNRGEPVLASKHHVEVNELFKST